MCRTKDVCVRSRIQANQFLTKLYFISSRAPIPPQPSFLPLSSSNTSGYSILDQSNAYMRSASEIMLSSGSSDDDADYQIGSGEYRPRRKKKTAATTTSLISDKLKEQLKQTASRQYSPPATRTLAEVIDLSSGEDDYSEPLDSYRQPFNGILDAGDCVLVSEEPYASTSSRETFDWNNCGNHTDDTCNIRDEQGRVLINYGHLSGDEDIFLAPQLCHIVRPHQIGGIRFMYDNVIETTAQFKVDSKGMGCILAHSMGLGKTMQVIAFIDVFLTHTSAKHVLCIVPINTLQNWIAEFNMWFPANGVIEVRMPLIVIGN